MLKNNDNNNKQGKPSAFPNLLKTMRQPSQKNLAKYSSTLYFAAISTCTFQDHTVKIISKLYI